MLYSFVLQKKRNAYVLGVLICKAEYVIMYELNLCARFWEFLGHFRTNRPGVLGIQEP